MSHDVPKHLLPKVSKTVMYSDIEELQEHIELITEGLGNLSKAVEIMMHKTNGLELRLKALEDRNGDEGQSGVLVPRL
jgi:regulator of replication initiation timing